MAVTFPGETDAYRSARNRHLEHEVALRREMEDVAAERRALPPGGIVPHDYVFEAAGPNGTTCNVRLSELFGPGRDSLVIYNFMFPRAADDDRPGPRTGASASLPLAKGPCPSCTSLLDQLEGAADHVAPRVNLVAVAKAPFDHVHTFAVERGWRRLRVVSSANNTYNRAYRGETDDGDQMPMLNVFHRDGHVIRHFWGAELLYASTEPGQDMRHVGTIEPLWNIFDLTPDGRSDDWDEQLEYDR